jgi:hypothetical protein
MKTLIDVLVYLQLSARDRLITDLFVVLKGAHMDHLVSRESVDALDAQLVADEEEEVMLERQAATHLRANSELDRIAFNQPATSRLKYRTLSSPLAVPQHTTFDHTYMNHHSPSRLHNTTALWPEHQRHETAHQPTVQEYAFHPASHNTCTTSTPFPSPYQWLCNVRERVRV